MDFTERDDMNWYRSQNRSLSISIAQTRQILLRLKFIEPDIDLKELGYNDLVKLVQKHQLNREGITSERMASALFFMIKNNSTIDEDTEE